MRGGESARDSPPARGWEGADGDWPAARKKKKQQKTRNDNDDDPRDSPTRASPHPRRSARAEGRRKRRGEAALQMTTDECASALPASRPRPYRASVGSPSTTLTTSTTSTPTEGESGGGCPAPSATHGAARGPRPAAAGRRAQAAGALPRGGRPRRAAQEVGLELAQAEERAAEVVDGAPRVGDDGERPKTLSKQLATWTRTPRVMRRSGSAAKTSGATRSTAAARTPGQSR